METTKILLDKEQTILPQKFGGTNKKIVFVFYIFKGESNSPFFYEYL